MKKRFFKKENGYILGMVLISFVIFSILGLAFIKMGGSEQLATLRHYQRAQAYYNAEAGIYKGMWRLNNVGVNSASFSDSTVTVICDTANKHITATGKSGSIQRVMQATFSSSNPYEIDNLERL